VELDSLRALSDEAWRERLGLGAGLATTCSPRHNHGVTDWTTLIVAGLGVAGTLGVTVMTQRSSAQRDDKRWTQERDAERERWQRQSTRDDSRHWPSERREIYVDFLFKLNAYVNATIRVLSAGVACVVDAAVHRDAMDFH
jgi:hypothetical protein